MQVVQFALKKKRRKTTVQLKIVQDEIVVFFYVRAAYFMHLSYFQQIFLFSFTHLTNQHPKSKV